MDNKKPKLLLLGYTGLDSSLKNIGGSISKYSAKINKIRIITDEPFLSKHEKYALLENKPKTISSAISYDINLCVSERQKNCKELKKLFEIPGFVASVKSNLKTLQNFYLELTGMKEYAGIVEGGIPLVHHYTLLSILFQCTEIKERMQLLSAMEETLHKWNNIKKDEYLSAEFAIMMFNRQFILNNINFIPRNPNDLILFSNLIGNLIIETANIRSYFFYNTIKCAITESKDNELIVGITDLPSVIKLQEKISKLEKKIGQIDKTLVAFEGILSN